MSRYKAACVTLLVAGAGTVGIAQAVVSVEEFTRAMKTIGTAIEGVNKAIGSRSYVDAKTPLALSRQILASTRPWWAASENPDAVRMTKEAVATLDALDKSLSGTAVDASAVATAVQAATRACDACHTAYRDGDERTGYKIKARKGGDGR
jgi:cytochrome c556